MTWTNGRDETDEQRVERSDTIAAEWGIGDPLHPGRAELRRPLRFSGSIEVGGVEFDGLTAGQARRIIDREIARLTAEFPAPDEWLTGYLADLRAQRPPDCELPNAGEAARPVDAAATPA